MLRLYISFMLLFPLSALAMQGNSIPINDVQHQTSLRLESEVVDGCALVYHAYLNGKKIGYADIHWQPSNYRIDKNDLFLRYIEISNENDRRKKYGTQLIQLILQDLRQEAEIPYLLAEAKPWLLPFHEKNGARVIGEINNMIGKYPIAYDLQENGFERSKQKEIKPKFSSIQEFLASHRDNKINNAISSNA